MAPLAQSTSSLPWSGLGRRVASDNCSGWDCLGDAAQFGIILVIIAVVLVLAYMYWRFKIKANLDRGAGTDDRTPASGYWEITRGRPNRVSITIHREPNPSIDEDVGETQNRTSGRSKQNSQKTQPEESNLEQAPRQFGMSGTSDIHLVPPPPPAPPVFWTTAAPSMIPPPPPFGPPTFLPPGPNPPGPYPPPPLQPNPLGFGAAATPYTPEAPPPYFHYPAPHNFQAQVPAQPTYAPPPGRSPAISRNSNDGTAQATPLAGDQGQKRRWFSMPFRSPTVGHARTLSDSSSPATRSSSPSPLPPSVSSSSPDRDRGHSRRPPGGRVRSSSARHHPIPRTAQSPRQNLHSSSELQRSNDAPSRPEPSFCSSYLNPSARVTHHDEEQDSESRPHTRGFRRNERHGRRDHNQEARLAPSESIPLSTLGHQRRPSARGSRRQPSSDLQYQSPEPRRARVSFTLPRDSDDASTSSSRSLEPEARSGTPTRRLRRDHHGDAHRRRSQVQAKREQPRLVDKVTGTFYRMRRALRGED